MEKVVEEYWSNAPQKNVIENIAGRSSELEAINNYLHDGGKLSDMEISETIIIRVE